MPARAATPCSTDVANEVNARAVATPPSSTPTHPLLEAAAASTSGPGGVEERRRHSPLSSTHSSSRQPHHNTRSVRRRSADLDFSAVSATTVTLSNTRFEDSQAAAEEANSRVNGGQRCFTTSDDTVSSAGPSAAFALLDGAPPPSGLRDPGTLLQLIPLDLLLHRENASSQPPAFTCSQDAGRPGREGPGSGALRHQDTAAAAAGTFDAAANPSKSLRWNDYRQAFSLLRCERRPSSMLSRSSAWQACAQPDPARPPDASAVHAAIGRVMRDPQHRRQVGEPPAHTHAHLSVYHHRSSKRAHSPPLIDENTTLLCSLADDLDTAPPPLPPQQQQQQKGVDATDADESPGSAVVPLVLFAAVVECPPDIRRFFLLSRTHAYLCNPDGTVAYCAAVRDVRQIVACADGYMVWRFKPNVVVLTMIMHNVRDEKRRSGEVRTSSTSTATAPTNSGESATLAHNTAVPQEVPSDTSPALQQQHQQTQRGSPSAPSTAASSPHPAATLHDTRDETSDWVFRFVSVGGCNAAATRSASLRDDGWAEERTRAMEFLLNVMCTLRTLPRLFTDAMVIAGGKGGGPGSALSSLPSTQTRGDYGNSGGGSGGLHSPSRDWARTDITISSSAQVHVADSLDKMHVAGDRPSRVPLLLEGPVGRQTAVKFVEQYWTTRYDQLPPALRPRRLGPTSYLSSTGAQSTATTAAAREGCTGAHVCYVESSLLLPPISVLSLSACLAAEDNVMDVLQSTSDAVRDVLSTAAGPTKAAHCCSSLDSGAAIPLKNLRDPNERVKAKGTLSAPAWRVLDELTCDHSPDECENGSSDNNSGTSSSSHHHHDHLHRCGARQRGKEAAKGRFRVDGTALTTPVTPDAASTRPHSKDTSSRSSNLSVEGKAAATVDVVVAPPKVRSNSSALSSRSDSRASDGDRRCRSTAEAATEAAHAETGSETPVRCSRVVSSPPPSDNAMLVTTPPSPPPLPAPNDHIVTTATASAVDQAGNGSDEGGGSPSSLLLLRVSCPSVHTSAASNHKNCCSDRSHSRSVREVKDVGVTETRVRAKLSCSVAKAVAQARCRRPRVNTAASTASGDAHTSVRAHPSLPPPSTDQKSSTHDHDEDGVCVRSANVTRQTTDAVESFEHRIRHRPRRDRLLLRARYITQLLQPPLRSSGVCVGCHVGHDALPAEEQPRTVQHDGSAAITGVHRSRLTCASGLDRFSLADPQRLVDDLRRQRVVAELLLIQQQEASSAASTRGVVPSATAAPFGMAQPLLLTSPPPSAGGIDVHQ
jgi:hypothetical protein